MLFVVIGSLDRKLHFGLLSSLAHKRLLHGAIRFFMYSNLA